jgi:hypothetical protein
VVVVVVVVLLLLLLLAHRSHSAVASALAQARSLPSSRGP